ncbi:MAG: UbiA family prenyltransferase [Pirellulales bacterium]|nr:UbiA family prenyltransferase [Pirellulales bacterium]
MTPDETTSAPRRPAAHSATVLAYLQLGRVPNVFTALADVLLGWFMVERAPQPSATLAALLLASACLYTSGMVLNDAYDADVDARERPRRPIPSQRVRRRLAFQLGFALLALGAAAGCAVSLLEQSWAPACVAGALALVIYAYDRGLKHTPLGPWAMGACRGLNVLLGMSPGAESWHAPHYLVAGGLTIYIAGVTLFARQEAQQSRREGLVMALAVMLAGLGLLACLPRIVAADVRADIVAERWWLLLSLVAAPIAMRCLLAIFQPDPRHVMMAVKTGIVSIILLDATLCAWLRGMGPAVVIATLVFPTLALGRWVYST